VTRARDKGEATMLAMPRPRNFSAAARACASPVSFSGMSMLPCDRFFAFQSVSPWRRNQKARGVTVSVRCVLRPVSRTAN
jgi:hypothetical protein